MEFVLLIMVLCLLVMGLIGVGKLIYINLIVHIDNLSKKEVSEHIYKYALSVVANEYEQAGKEIYTKKGEYRAAFLSKVKAKVAELSSVLGSEGVFIEDFVDYSYSRYREIRRKDIPSVISEYMFELENRSRRLYDDISSRHPFITVNQFMEYRKRSNGDCVGIYVIYNISKNMYYVGQAKRLLFRINQHFTGHGNGEVYADFLYGDEFVLQMIPLAGSGFSDIDEMERVMIQKYDAYNTGYNRTVGNK